MGNPQLPPGIFYQSNVIFLTRPDSALPTKHKARNFASSSEQFIFSPHTKSPIAVVRNRLREKGRCFVALANEKLVGTTSVSFYQGKSWYDKDKLVAHSMLSAVLPKYQGIGITDDLNVLRDAYIREMGVDLIQGDTAEDNLVVRKNAKRNGFHEVEYHAYQSNHYSVLFVKWLNGCPFSEKYISRRCKISKFLVKTQYKPGRIERSRLLSMFCNAIRKIVF